MYASDNLLSISHHAKLWHKFDNMPYSDRAPKKPKPPLDEAGLRSLGLFYVGKYATTRAKLATYLARKIRERGWAGVETPDVDTLIANFAELGYVDDAAFATARAASLVRRGFGEGRIRMSLRHAGIGGEAAATISHLEGDEALASAMRFAKRKRIGPFGMPTTDPKLRNRAFAAMIRAGHTFEIARTVLDMQSDVDATD